MVACQSPLRAPSRRRYSFSACARKLGKRFSGCHGWIRARGQGPAVQKRQVSPQTARDAQLDGPRLSGAVQVHRVSAQQFRGVGESPVEREGKSCWWQPAPVLRRGSDFISFSDVCGLFVFSTVAAVNAVDGEIICPAWADL